MYNFGIFIIKFLIVWVRKNIIILLFLINKSLNIIEIVILGMITYVYNINVTKSVKE